ncbi:MAG: hypothetical protein A3G18_03060 [Rhodospirillales bacterium RIFCSPLOWO2_12_FULL_58_28]|nr:MAG: hypothetical protein A3H92_06495 [Rhodospirillales bacterium RIFCSPLOWO2_02_FULL_58_16]OHC77206.1 MAG: hypothetical protein A3G18_03060 [Rhodospirillales bacterium RIFCSPLOWO2_12_FULL_58_28]
MADLTLSSAVRSNLLSLQNTSSLIDRTQGRMNTQLKVASPMDDAVKYFQAKSLGDRARDLSERKDAIEQGVSSLETALKAAESLESLVKQMKGAIDSARSSDKTQRASLTDQIEVLADQIQKLVDDASYKGLNLINSTASSLAVRFSEKSGSKLTVDGVDFNMSQFFKDSAGASADAVSAAKLLTAIGFSAGGGFAGLSSYDLSVAAELASFNVMADSAIMSLDETISSLRSKASTMASNVAILRVRSDFTTQYMNVLDTGAGKLTIADLNEEGANLLALQTRQQLGIQAMSFAAQAEQGILGLFR